MGYGGNSGRSQVVIPRLWNLPVSRTTNDSGACSSVDRTYVKAKPGVTTLVMAENHTKTKSSGVQYQAECCHEQEGSSQA